MARHRRACHHALLRSRGGLLFTNVASGPEETPPSAEAGHSTEAPPRTLTLDEAKAARAKSLERRKRNCEAEALQLRTPTKDAPRREIITYLFLFKAGLDGFNAATDPLIPDIVQMVGSERVDTVCVIGKTLAGEEPAEDLSLARASVIADALIKAGILESMLVLIAGETRFNNPNLAVDQTDRAVWPDPAAALRGHLLHDPML